MFIIAWMHHHGERAAQQVGLLQLSEGKLLIGSDNREVDRNDMLKTTIGQLRMMWDEPDLVSWLPEIATVWLYESTNKQAPCELAWLSAILVDTNELGEVS